MMLSFPFVSIHLSLLDRPDAKSDRFGYTSNAYSFARFFLFIYEMSFVSQWYFCFDAIASFSCLLLIRRVPQYKPGLDWTVLDRNEKQFFCVALSKKARIHLNKFQISSKQIKEFSLLKNL
ncbi:hypothetical protein L1987_03332 [Smallanthus sonchifolius]|uniref:Uncharacterized protein n=1 Tax=Smallanthus sonchifolius TaxID=185202 RepID=A0ACB9KAA9_9ASTR|nr:hypothetical protein L1987_03332 [Smallanthus sonchifolius]